MSDNDAETNQTAELEAKLQTFAVEIRNCHALLAILVSRNDGAIAISDAEMASADALGRLEFHREDRIPGCLMLLRTLQ